MKKYSNETIVGIFVVLGLVAISFMAVKLGNISLVGDNTKTYYAPFSTVSGLRVGNSVEMLGLEIGRVAAFRMDQEKLQAVVTLELDRSIEVFDDAIASIKTAGLIGDKYVNIDPGGGGDLLADGDTIIETESPVDLADLISKYAFGDVGE
ncbi:MAG: outer membrane lipid asymmetry maintenance protein MlaD [Desulfobacterales bacterium]|nr:outer membrane lipid asymmetry maintenance protein MlaD [Desulfobacterales bacterium]